MRCTWSISQFTRNKRRFGGPVTQISAFAWRSQKSMACIVCSASTGCFVRVWGASRVCQMNIVQTIRRQVLAYDGLLFTCFSASLMIGRPVNLSVLPVLGKTMLTRPSWWEPHTRHEPPHIVAYRMYERSNWGLCSYESKRRYVCVCAVRKSGMAKFWRKLYQLDLWLHLQRQHARSGSRRDRLQMRHAPL